MSKEVNNLKPGESEDKSKTSKQPDGSTQTDTSHDQGGEPQVHEESHKSEPAKD